MASGLMCAKRVLPGTTGDDHLLNRTAMSQNTEVLWEEYESSAQRDLSGFEVEPGDVESLRAALRRLINDPHLRAIQGARNRRIVAQKYSRDNIIAMRNLLLKTGIQEQAGCLQDLQTES